MTWVLEAAREEQRKREEKALDSVVVKDSGKRQEFSTGARRDTNEGKGRYDLLPPLAIHLIARQFEEGAKKYGPNNWRKGIPLWRIIDSGTRHLFKHLAGFTDEDHLVGAAWNLLAALETRELVRSGKLPQELLDPPGEDKE